VDGILSDNLDCKGLLVYMLLDLVHHIVVCLRVVESSGNVMARDAREGK